MGFRSVPKSMALNKLERRNMVTAAFWFSPKTVGFKANHVMAEARPTTKTCMCLEEKHSLVKSENECWDQKRFICETVQAKNT